MSKTDTNFSTMIQDAAKGSVILIMGQMASTAISALGAILVARLLGSTSCGLRARIIHGGYTQSMKLSDYCVFRIIST